MKRWLRDSGLRIGGLTGIIALWILDVATSDYKETIRNGFWVMDGEKAFHVAIAVAVGVCCLMVLKK